VNTYRLHYFSQSLPQDHTVDVEAPTLADVFTMVDRKTFPPGVFVLSDWSLLKVECVDSDNLLISTLKAHHAEIVEALGSLQNSLAGVEDAANAANEHERWAAYERGEGPKPR
jgi:hypothetical protein